MSDAVKLTLTPTEAKVIFNTIDGAADAGACEGGNTEQEGEALASVMLKLIKQRDKWRSVILDEG